MNDFFCLIKLSAFGGLG